MTIAPLRKKFLGEVLLKEQLITKEELEKALKDQEKTKEPLGVILVKSGLITEEELLRGLSICHSLPLIKITDAAISQDALKLIPEKVARRFTILPISKEGQVLKVAVSDPSNIMALDEVGLDKAIKLSRVLAGEKEIKEAIERCYGGAAFLGKEHFSEEGAIEEITPAGEDKREATEDLEAIDAAPVIKYVNSLMFEAVSKGASDIHIEPLEDNVSLRLRLDGKLRDFPPPPRKFYSAIISRIKIMANLDIAERRLPQDGKCKIKIANKKVDIRVSTLPTIYGEKIVMRILDRSSVSLVFDDLGFTKDDAVKFKEALERPYGMILVTGPTGSGKTTTLYTGLNYINSPDRNIVTAEDPVEYELRNINQVQVKPMIGLTFANILRSVLRQDPDIIMVGEIRDKETAEIAIQSALTGHLVLSTLHTNDAVSSLSRLRYMGIEPFLIADSVDLVMAQRLVRKICPSCRKPQDVPAHVLARLGVKMAPGQQFFMGAGCDRCFNTGYKGRSAIIELLKLSDNIKKMVIAEEGDLFIKEQAIKEGMRTLREVAVEALKKGITTIDEVLTVTNQ
jgi:type IV pilus assembly protein PilB